MTRSRSMIRLVAVMFAAISSIEAAPQTQGPTPIASASPSSSTSLASSTTDSASVMTASSSSDTPMSLWDMANSLLSSYYPSTTISQVDTLTWPTAVVIHSTTYSVHPGTTGSATTSVLAEATGNASNEVSHGLSSDKKLGIAIGVSVGVVALAVLALVFCCLRRRKRSTGAYFLRRPTSSVTDSDVEAWRSPRQAEVSMLSSAPSSDWIDKYNRMPRGEDAPTMAAGLVRPPPMAMHPAFARQYSHYSNQSSSEENPFFTPQERSEHYEMEGEAAGALHKELDADEPAGRRSSSSIRQSPRPPTPMNPFMALMSGGQSSQPAQHDAEQQQQQHNPFASPEDDEHDEHRDLVSPIIPARSPERRHSPMVHYPSWSEVSEFDFSGDGRRSVRGQSSNEDGGDGWRPTRDSAYGRHELA